MIMEKQTQTKKVLLKVGSLLSGHNPPPPPPPKCHLTWFFVCTFDTFLCLHKYWVHISFSGHAKTDFDDKCVGWTGKYKIKLNIDFSSWIYSSFHKINRRPLFKFAYEISKITERTFSPISKRNMFGRSNIVFLWYC